MGSFGGVDGGWWIIAGVVAAAVLTALCALLHRPMPCLVHTRPRMKVRVKIWSDK